MKHFVRSLWLLGLLWCFLLTGSVVVLADTETEIPQTPSLSLLETEAHQAYINGYEDNTIRPNKSITRAETATIFYRLLTEESRETLTTSTNHFSDVNQSHWFHTAVSTLASADILNGYPNGKFSPNKAITRGEFAAIICRFIKDMDKEALCPFNDAKGHWAEQFIAYAATQAWLTGYPNGNFEPERRISRAEAMTVINRMLGRGTDHEHMLQGMIQWSDNMLRSVSNQNGVETTNPWFYCAVQEATNSHEYTIQNDIEQWTKLTKNPNWGQPVTDFYQMVVNRDNPIKHPENYVPPTGLVTIKGTNQKMETQAAAALERMLKDLRSAGISALVVSGYRTYEKQVSLYNRQVQRVIANNPGISRAEAERIAATISAIPGTSEHELGLAVDLGTGGSLKESFANTAAGKWIHAHCAEYGFILRYPKDKQHITGIIYEPWHFRYVGVEAAKDIKASGLCMEEYYGIYLSQTDEVLDPPNFELTEDAE
ncbi:MAG: D-alanyl-D-alanine carboxypeptidase family protein [Bacillota bacterium]|nr:D-alanyl-D-alanine carboxypeptidase family protein [Bacillota bacterium]